MIVVSTTRDGRRVLVSQGKIYTSRLSSYRPRRSRDRYYDIPRGFASEVRHLPLLGEDALRQLRSEYGVE
jgi:hypothetical protein